jgi:hypothetical protein
MVRICNLPLLVSIVLCLTGCNRTQTSANKPIQPAPAAVLDSSGGATEVAGYMVNPPKGYSVVTPPPNAGPPGAKFAFWGGTKRPDGTAPMFGVMVGSPPSKEKLPALDEFLNIMLQGVKKQRIAPTWTQSPFEELKLGGLTFKRTRWSGTDLKNGWKMHGLMYVAIDGRTFIQITSQDVEPHHEEALKLSETAAQSFKKK